MKFLLDGEIQYQDLEAVNIIGNLHVAEFILFYCIDKIHTKCQVEELTNEEVLQLNFFLNLFTKTAVFVSSYRLNFLFQILWKKTSPVNEIQVEYKHGQIKSVQVGNKDFIGSFSQLPNSVKIFYSLQKLLFKNSYTIRCKGGKTTKETLITEQQYDGYQQQDRQIIFNRIKVFELILTLFYIEKAFGKIEKCEANMLLVFFSHFQFGNQFLKALLKIAFSYQENGILPYSSYFYKKLLQ